MAYGIGSGRGGRSGRGGQNIQGLYGELGKPLMGGATPDWWHIPSFAEGGWYSGRPPNPWGGIWSLPFHYKNWAAYYAAGGSPPGQGGGEGSGPGAHVPQVKGGGSPSGGGLPDDWGDFDEPEVDPHLDDPDDWGGYPPGEGDPPGLPPLGGGTPGSLPTYNIMSGKCVTGFEPGCIAPAGNPYRRKTR